MDRFDKRAKKIRRRDAIKSSSRLWTENYAPETMAELLVCVHSGTIDRVRSWLETSSTSSGIDLPFPKRLLILSGKPGIGKSTTVRVLSKDLGIDLIEWHSHGQAQMWRDNDFDGDFTNAQSEANLDPASIRSFREPLVRC